VTLVVPKEQTALSNMPVKAESEEGGLKVRTYLNPKPKTLNKAESEEGGLKVHPSLLETLSLRGSGRDPRACW
jgi:hypothetical protein